MTFYRQKLTVWPGKSILSAKVGMARVGTKHDLLKMT